MRCRYLALLAFSALFFAGSGCVMQPSIATETTIAGGEKYQLLLTGGGIPKTEDKTLRIDMAGLMLDPKSTLACFQCKIFFKQPVKLKSVIVEDISEDPITPVLYDEAPVIKNGVYDQTSAYKPLTDPLYKWLYLLDNTIRVYRITLTMADGRVLVYKQGDFYNQYIKEGIRRGMGIKT